MIVPLGPWEPDAAGVDAQVLAIAKNVYPTKEGYGPIPALSDNSTDALPAGCIGLFSARTSAGGWVIFAGTKTHLYRYVSGTWVDYTRVSGGAYSVLESDYWSFDQFGSQVIACNISDAPQVIDIDSGAAAFSALGGSPPQARYVRVIGDFVTLGCLSSNNLSLINSAINDATGWSIGTNLCDQQDFPDGGRVTGIAGGEFGFVMQEHAIRRMIFQPGSDLAFRFERVESERGAGAGYSVVSTINDVFFLSDDGFYAYGNNGLVPIGGQKVNKWFRSNSDTARFFSVLAFADPYAPRVAWAFFNAAGSTVFDRLLIYDWQLDRWSYAEVSAQYWARLLTSGVTLEDLDVYGSIDTGVPYSLDSRVWEGGAPVIGAIGTNGKLAFLEGALPLAATLTTCPMHLTEGARSNVSDVYPLGVFNGGTIGIRVGRREHTGAAATYTASVAPSTRSGIARFKASGRVHEIELSILQTTGTAWAHAQGFDVSASPDGLR